MTMTKRERWIGVGAVVVIAALALDQLMISPLLARKSELDARVESSVEQLDRASRTFSTSRRATRKWSELTRPGLPTDDSASESEVLNKLREWAQESSMTLSAVKRERTEKQSEFDRISFRATGTGEMNQIGRFLWRVENAAIPLRITDMQLSSRKDGTDDLSLQLGLATIFHSPEKSVKPEGAR